MKMKFGTMYSRKLQHTEKGILNKIRLFSTKTPILPDWIHQEPYLWEVSHEDILSLNGKYFQ